MDEFTDTTGTAAVIDVEPPEPEQADTSTAEPEPAATDEPEQADSPNREAAKYRRQLREAEKSLQAAQEAATAAQRTLVDSLAQSAGRIRPEALWASGVTLADLLDDSGNVDVTKVTAAADEAASRLGLTRRPKPDPAQGGAGYAPKAGAAWDEAFTPRRR